MNHVLITGVKEPAGGVEKVVMTYVNGFSNPSLITDFAVFGEKLSFEDEITKKGGTVYYLPNRVKSRAEYKKDLDEIFKNGNYDAVWCNFSGLTNIDFLKKAKKYNVEKRIAHAHTSGYFWGSKLMKYLVPVFHRANRVVLPRYANCFWTCSEKAARFMFGNKYAKKAVKINNAIQTEKFAFDSEKRTDVRNEFGISPEAFVAGHVGRMCTAKNQLFLLDIMKEIIKINADSKLLFVGDGELHDSVVKYAEDIGISDSVIFTGVRNDIPRILQAFDCFALPSVSEGLPVVLIEAQAADVPCITTAGAVSEEVNLTGNVLFVSLDEPADIWAKKIINHSRHKPHDGIEKLKASGYDISLEAQKLESVFLEKNK